MKNLPCTKSLCEFKAQSSASFSKLCKFFKNQETILHLAARRGDHEQIDAVGTRFDLDQYDLVWGNFVL